jgi:hypothetical protein
MNVDDPVFRAFMDWIHAGGGDKLDAFCAGVRRGEADLAALRAEVRRLRHLFPEHDRGWLREHPAIAAALEEEG